jgi:hypothetical protein
MMDFRLKPPNLISIAAVSLWIVFFPACNSCRNSVVREVRGETAVAILSVRICGSASGYVVTVQKDSSTKEVLLLTSHERNLSRETLLTNPPRVTWASRQDLKIEYAPGSLNVVNRVDNAFGINIHAITKAGG